MTVPTPLGQPAGGSRRPPGRPPRRRLPRTGTSRRGWTRPRHLNGRSAQAPYRLRLRRRRGPGGGPDRDAPGAGGPGHHARRHLRGLGRRRRRRRFRRRPTAAGVERMAALSRNATMGRRLPPGRLPAPCVSSNSARPSTATTALRRLIEAGLTFEPLRGRPRPPRGGGHLPHRRPHPVVHLRPRRSRPSWPRPPCPRCCPRWRSAPRSSSTAAWSTTSPSAGPSPGGPSASSSSSADPSATPTAPTAGRSRPSSPLSSSPSTPSSPASSNTSPRHRGHRLLRRLRPRLPLPRLLGHRGPHRRRPGQRRHHPRFLAGRGPRFGDQPPPRLRSRRARDHLGRSGMTTTPSRSPAHSASDSPAGRPAPPPAPFADPALLGHLNLIELSRGVDPLGHRRGPPRERRDRPLRHRLLAPRRLQRRLPQ